MIKFPIKGNNGSQGFVNGGPSSALSAQGPEVGLGTISNSPSGLVVRPSIGDDPVDVARSVIARGYPFPNNRIVIQAQDRPVDVTPQMTEHLHSLAQDTGITIGLKVAVEPYAYEFEPAAAVARQLEQGALIALPKEIDIRRITRLFPQSILNRMKERMANSKAEPSERLYGDFVEELLKKDRFELTPDEKEFLARLADIAITRRVIAQEGHNIFYLFHCHSSVKIFKALHDFGQLRRIAEMLQFAYGRLHHDNFDKVSTLFYLEEFEEACRIVDMKNSSKEFFSLGDMYYTDSTIFECFGILGLLGERALEYKDKYGYDDYEGAYHEYHAASAMWQLRQDYDLAIPIARGGLNCGSMAELFGMETRVIEVHAHDREIPTSKFLDDIKPEDIKGKRILLMDKDMVSGASLKEAIRLLAPYQPAALGVYLNIPTTNAADLEAVEELEAMGLTIHDSINVELIPALEMFYELNERLDTPLGQLRRVLREFRQELDCDRHLNPEAADDILAYVDDQERMYFALNHHLPGMDMVREHIAYRLKDLLDLYKEKQDFVQYSQDSASPDLALTYIALAASKKAPLFEYTAEELARGRYSEWGLKLAREHKSQLEYTPHSFNAAFHTAKRALADAYDAALIVGPEGFRFQPIFEDLGIPTVAINIPEADFDGERTLTAFDDLSQLKGKRVLVVEDDVQSGATLKKVLEGLEDNQPAHLGLFLGSYAFAQKMENIPPEFKDVYLTGRDPADWEVFIEHLQNREKLFKKSNQPVFKTPPFPFFRL